jgi:hypothetical protein
MADNLDDESLLLNFGLLTAAKRLASSFLRLIEVLQFQQRTVLLGRHVIAPPYDHTKGSRGETKPNTVKELQLVNLVLTAALQMQTSAGESSLRHFAVQLRQPKIS